MWTSFCLLLLVGWLVRLARNGTDKALVEALGVTFLACSILVASWLGVTSEEGEVDPGGWTAVLHMTFALAGLAFLIAAVPVTRYAREKRSVGRLVRILIIILVKLFGRRPAGRLDRSVHPHDAVTSRFESIPFRIWIPGAIVVFALFASLGAWPYVYYQLLRWAVMGVAVWFAMKARHTRAWLSYALGGVALLFNPVIPFHFGREAWQVLDAVAGAFFVVATALTATTQSPPRSNAGNQGRAPGARDDTGNEKTAGGG